MGEMTYEPLPTVSVPLIRPWLRREYRMLARTFYGGSGFFFAWGLLFWLWFIIIGVKAIIFWTIVAAMVVAWCCTATADVITYKRRLRDAQVRAWAQYLASGETA